MVLRVQQQLRCPCRLLCVHVRAGRDDAAWQPHQAFHLREVGSRTSSTSSQQRSAARAVGSWQCGELASSRRTNDGWSKQRVQARMHAYLLNAAASSTHPQAALLRGVAKQAPAAGAAGVHRQAASARHRHISAVLADGRVQLQRGQEGRGGKVKGDGEGMEGVRHADCGLVHPGSSTSVQAVHAVQQHTPAGRRPRYTAAAA